PAPETFGLATASALETDTSGELAAGMTLPAVSLTPSCESLGSCGWLDWCTTGAFGVTEGAGRRTRLAGAAGDSTGPLAATPTASNADSTMSSNRPVTAAKAVDPTKMAATGSTTKKRTLLRLLRSCSDTMSRSRVKRAPLCSCPESLSALVACCTI